MSVLSEINRITGEVNSQAELLNEIIEALQSKITVSSASTAASATNDEDD